MQKFKQHWQIDKNSQLLFPFLGLITLLYSSYRLAKILSSGYHLLITLLLTVIIGYTLLKLCLFFFKKLESKWKVESKWEIIRIFIVFAITGSSSIFVGRPIVKFIGIAKENLNIVLYWILFIAISLIFYQILLVFYGWIFGQFNFFWNFEKKILRKFGVNIK